MRQHADLRNLRTSRRVEAALNIALGVVLGLMLAVCLVAWWSS